VRYYLLLITCVSLTAQSVDKSVISTIGNAYTSQTVSVSYNAGELIIGNLTSEDGAIQLSSGYYESLNLETLHIDIPELKFELNLYPNPVRDALYIDHPTLSEFIVSIHDMKGRLLLEKLLQVRKPIPTSNLSLGAYIVSVKSIDNLKINSYKIIKE
jgi:hypothetical protein